MLTATAATPCLTRLVCAYYPSRAVTPPASHSLLRHLCDQQGVSLLWLSQETDLSVDTLSKIASGRRQPLVTTALLIAEALDVEVEALTRRQPQ